MIYRCDFDDDFFEDGEPEEGGGGWFAEDPEEDYAAGAINGDEDDWPPEDYADSAEQIFGDSPYFGEHLADQLGEYGFRLFDDAGFLDAFDSVAPGASETVQLFERDGMLHAFGFVPLALLPLLRQQYSGIDFSNLRASVPLRGELAAPRPLPAAFAALQPAPAADLRAHCSPVGDQQDTSRCSAFAWTHALEMMRTLGGLPPRRLSPNFTMLQFQRMQGDARDYEHAFEGGTGTVSGIEPGKWLLATGSCRQELWPDPQPEPRAAERELQRDAGQHRVPAQPHPVTLDDARKVLTAGFPIHLGLNTGPAFTTAGRDGLISAAEPPSGRHGRHALLLVGYQGNFYTAKNSWGERWGDRGYCYIPKSVLAASEPELVAMLPVVR